MAQPLCEDTRQDTGSHDECSSENYVQQNKKILPPRCMLEDLITSLCGCIIIHISRINSTISIHSIIVTFSALLGVDPAILVDSACSSTDGDFAMSTNQNGQIESPSFHEEYKL